MGYTTRKGAALLGFGASAISTLKQGFSQNEKDPVTYQKRIAEESFATIKGYIRTSEDSLRAEVIEQVLCSGVVNFNELSHAHPEITMKSPRNLELFVEEGLVELNSNGFKVTELGRYFSRNIAAVFDEYLVKHKATKTFSQAV